MDHVQVQLDSMSRKKFLQIVYYDPELDPVLNEAIELLRHSDISTTHTYPYSCRTVLTMTLMLAMTLGSSSEMTESVIFHPIDNIHTSISSWIVTTALDFEPYNIMLYNVNEYAKSIRNYLISQMPLFQYKDPRYIHLFNMTLDDINMAITEISTTRLEASNLIDHALNNNNKRFKRSLLPLGGLFSFLFGTADQSDVNSLKADVKELYENQVDQTQILDEIVTITNISRGLINENRLNINMIIDTILSINETILNIKEHIQTLFTARRFLLLHSEFIIHHTRIRYLMKQLQHDMTLIREYLNIHSTGRLNPNIIDPIHLRRELININKQLPTQLSLPENPRTNIWHYYKFLTVTPISHDNKIILMIKFPLIDLDSTMTLYKTYNLPIFHHEIGKSLIYNIEGNNLAVTKDNNYATILSDTEFIKCTLAQGHFCNLNTALHHIESNQMCLTALFLKDNNKIQNQCTLAVSNISGPQANYLDQGNWAISITV